MARITSSGALAAMLGWADELGASESVRRWASLGALVAFMFFFQLGMGPGAKTPRFATSPVQHDGPDHLESCSNQAVFHLPMHSSRLRRLTGASWVLFLSFSARAGHIRARPATLQGARCCAGRCRRWPGAGTRWRWCWCLALGAGAWRWCLAAVFGAGAGAWRWRLALVLGAGAWR